MPPVDLARPAEGRRWPPAFVAPPVGGDRPMASSLQRVPADSRPVELTRAAERGVHRTGAASSTRPKPTSRSAATARAGDAATAGAAAPFAHIVVAIDGSPATHAALDEAIAIGARSGSRVTIVAVVPFPSPAYVAALGGPAPPAIHEGGDRVLPERPQVRRGAGVRGRNRARVDRTPRGAGRRPDPGTNRPGVGEPPRGRCARSLFHRAVHPPERFDRAHGPRHLPGPDPPGRGAIDGS